ncbi:hypothetical protein BESB_067530 [Besnoitia besnoiti]|uniref:Transmembrane protein n=1 Tax=Besnoitia besnoiti TaxID=94643 RepID=A0A2A9MH22_BESBE|nr:hypothetical protein BESB_067530 [Besnoitia besnoiti]PFH34720.1 hypothetical protein BESB_067530 [Besnoitia besnoiti]
MFGFVVTFVSCIAIAGASLGHASTVASRRQPLEFDAVLTSDEPTPSITLTPHVYAAVSVLPEHGGLVSGTLPTAVQPDLVPESSFNGIASAVPDAHPVQATRTALGITREGEQHVGNKPRHEPEQNHVRVQINSPGASLSPRAPPPFSTASWYTSPETEHSHHRFRPEVRHPGSDVKAGDNPSVLSPREAGQERAKSTVPLAPPLRQSWLFSATRGKLHEAIEFMKNTGGTVRLQPSPSTNYAGFAFTEPAASLVYGAGADGGHGQSYPAPPGESHSQGDEGRDIHGQHDMLTQFYGTPSSAVAGRDVYVDESFASSTESLSRPALPPHQSATLSMTHRKDTTTTPWTGANLAFPLATKAYQFMVPRAELFLASSRYAEEYLDLFAALYCLFQKWSCNNVHEFAEQTRRHHNVTTAGDSAGAEGGRSS